jgi:hypothetical protein
MVSPKACTANFGGVAHCVDQNSHATTPLQGCGGKRVFAAEDGNLLYSDAEAVLARAPRRGGMTELEEAGLTGGQGRALSAHRSKAYDICQAHI